MRTVAPVLMFRAAIAALFIFVVACGGGSTSSSSGTIVPVTPRAGLHMGYWWGCAPYMLEQADHVDTWWAAGSCRDPAAASFYSSQAWHVNIAAELQQARGAGIRHVVILLPTVDVTQLRFEFIRLSDGGYFNGWESITLYPLDEPGSDAGGRWSDAAVTDLVTRLKQLALDIPGLANAHMGVFYGCDDSSKPGIKSYDRVGCFRYSGSGCARLEGDYAALRAQMSAGAMLWMVPGGADINGGRDGHQDPACWASYAHRNLDVWGVIAFMWHSGEDLRIPIVGIRENGMRKLYCETGRVILKPNEIPRC